MLFSAIFSLDHIEKNTIIGTNEFQEYYNILRASSPAVTVSTKMADSTAFSVNTVIKWFPITTGVFKLNMVLYFFGDGSRVLA